MLTLERLQHGSLLWKNLEISWWVGSVKCKSLSFAGRVVLINSILASLSIYFMSLFQAPSTVINNIDKIRRRFLWRDSEKIRKMIRVEWHRVCLPKKMGVAGVVDLKVKNRALLAKWGWRVACEKNALWRKVIVSKYGSTKPNWRFKLSKTKEMSVVW